MPVAPFRPAIGMSLLMALMSFVFIVSNQPTMVQQFEKTFPELLTVRWN